MTSDIGAVDLQADVEPLRCVLEIDLGGMVSITLLDACGAEDVHYAAAVVTRARIDLADLTVRHIRTRCPHEAHQFRMGAPQRQVNIYDAKSRLCRLIADVEKTRSGVVIARNGRPVAELLPLRATEFTPAAR